jgi:hypothetical protein
MYKFVVIKGSCGNPYDINACEQQTNQMAAQGFDLFQVYQSTTTACLGQGNSVLVMIFKRRG